MRTTNHNLGDKKGNFSVAVNMPTGRKDAEGKDITVKKSFDFTKIVLAAPADSEALASWHKSKKFVLGTGDDKVTFVGIEAAAAAKVLHDIETVRGKAREMLAGGASHDAVQTWLRSTMASYWPGKNIVEVVKEVVLDGAKLAAFYAAGDFEGAKAYMAECGVKIETAPEPEETEVERQAREMAEAVDRKLAAQDETAGGDETGETEE